jgi:hypothetical protein
MSLDLHVPREWIEARRRPERGELDDMTDANVDGCVDQRDLVLHPSRGGAVREEEHVDALQGVPQDLRPVEIDTRHGDADGKADLGGPPRQGNDDVQVIGRN